MSRRIPKFFPYPASLLCIALTLNGCALRSLNSTADAPAEAIATTVPAQAGTVAATGQTDTVPVTPPAAPSRDTVVTPTDPGSKATAATGAPAPSASATGSPRLKVIVRMPAGQGAFETIERSGTAPAGPVANVAKAPATAGNALPAVPVATPAKEPTKAVSRKQRRTAAARKDSRQGGKVAQVVKPQNLWDRVRGRLVLTGVEHPRIQEHIEYLKSRPGYLNALAERAQPLLHYVVEQLDQRGLPLDLALLPMVESGFQVTAVSPKAAAGLWQIIPSTGTEWGLLLTEGYDGRFDIHSSTLVAMDYLTYLNKIFKGDWLLALAAYNAGPRTVQAAIRTMPPLDPAPVLLADAAPAPVAGAVASATPVATDPVAAPPPVAAPAKPVANRAGKNRRGSGHGASLVLTAAKVTPAAAVVPAVGAVPVTGSTTTPPAPATSAAPATLAKQTPSATPAASATATAPAGSATPATPAMPVVLPPPSPYWQLKLPKETMDYVPRLLALVRIVANPPAYGLKLPPISNQPYLFRVETTPDINLTNALTFSGIPLEEFLRFNPGFKPDIEPPSRTYNLLLPWQQAETLVSNVPGTRLVAASKYTVKKGETLASIAKRHRLPAQKLAMWNNLDVNTVLKAGQQLIIYPAS